MNERTLRIISIMNDENMNATQFAEAIGIQRAAMSHITGGRNNPSADVIARIIERFPNVNPSWLLSGIGSMKISPDNSNISNISGNRIVSGAGSYNENEKTTNKTSNINQQDLFYQYEAQAPNVVNAGSDSNIRPEENIRTEIHFKDGKREGAGVKDLKNISKGTEKETVIYKERSVKTIDKILIFYSDNTYETFIPEKHGGGVNC